MFTLYHMMNLTFDFWDKSIIWKIEKFNEDGLCYELFNWSNILFKAATNSIHVSTKIRIILCMYHTHIKQLVQNLQKWNYLICIIESFHKLWQQFKID